MDKVKLIDYICSLLSQNPSLTDENLKQFPVLQTALANVGPEFVDNVIVAARQKLMSTSSSSSMYTTYVATDQQQAVASAPPQQFVQSFTNIPLQQSFAQSKPQQHPATINMPQQYGLHSNYAQTPLQHSYPTMPQVPIQPPVSQTFSTPISYAMMNQHSPLGYPSYANLAPSNMSTPLPSPQSFSHSKQLQNNTVNDILKEFRKTEFDIVSDKYYANTWKSQITNSKHESLLIVHLLTQ